MGSQDDILKGLQAWAGQFYGSDATVERLVRLSGGASQETWSLDVVRPGTVEELILRRVPGGRSVARNSEAIGLETEARLLSAAAGTVPAPKVIQVFQPDSDIGEAFLMNRIAGQTIARKILRDDTYKTARGKLTAQCGKALAAIHAIPTHDLPDLPRSGGLDQLEKYETIYRDFKLPRPVFELAMSWLKANRPDPVKPVLVHGDFRLGNLIVDSTGLAAVLDWELAHLGDPREDIAWICVNSWRFGHSDKRVGGFGQLEDLLVAYQAAGGHPFSAEEIDWWEILGSLKWGIMCMIMYEAFRSGADPSVERAAIGRRVSETEIDLINLLEQRA
ncbi:MAG: phosphotransferase family protein [Hyphomonas sp.]|nr:phosphotransferase family protein [Hyphomonas sp.]